MPGMAVRGNTAKGPSRMSSVRMLLELRRVSHKTPADGKLEVSPTSAERIRALGDSPVVVVDGSRGRGSVIEVSCTCSQGAEPHQHHFLESTLLKGLAPESEVAIDLLADAGTVVVVSRSASVSAPKGRRQVD